MKSDQELCRDNDVFRKWLWLEAYFQASKDPDISRISVADYADMAVTRFDKLFHPQP